MKRRLQTWLFFLAAAGLLAAAIFAPDVPAYIYEPGTNCRDLLELSPALRTESARIREKMYQVD